MNHAKRIKPSKRRRDDSEPDDQPQQEKRKRTSGSTSRHQTSGTQNPATQDIPLQTSDTDPRDAAEELNGHTSEHEVPLDIPANIDEPPMEA